MPFSEGSSSPNIRLDTGSAPPVPGPHDPQPVGFDESVATELRSRRDEALILRDAHSAELEAQGKFYAGEVERYDRVVRACNSALHELEPDRPDEPLTATQQIQRMPMSAAEQTRQIQRMRAEQGPITG